MSARAVLFDLDGTLTDSRPGILRSTRYAFAQLSAHKGQRFELPPDAELSWIVGPPIRQNFAKLAGSENVDSLVAFYRERYAAIGAFENEVYPGVPETLDALIATGARLYVATSKNRRDAERILAHFGLADRFQGVYGARDDGGHADKTELLSHLLAEQGLNPTRNGMAMVGDRKYDMIGARNVGVAALGALWGYGDATELEEAGADVLVATPQDVPAAISGLGKAGPPSF